MFNIINGGEVTFSAFKFDIDELTLILQKYEFNHHRPITRSMLIWYAFNDEQQKLINLETKLEIEHIYAKNRLPQLENIESIGNKSILEKKINIRASDFRFQDKKEYYLGNKPGRPRTQIHELIELADTKQDFTAQDINIRSGKIINRFIDFIKLNNLARS